MRKVLLIGALAAMTVAANVQAQVNFTPVANLNGVLEMAPDVYLKEALVYGIEDVGSNTLRFTIYNEDFESRKSFTISDMVGGLNEWGECDGLGLLNVRSGNDLDDFALSQYFFNDDDKYEIIRLIKSGPDNILQRAEVVSEDGTVLGELPLGLVKDYYISVFSIGMTNYILRDPDGVNLTATVVYRVDSSQPGKVSFEKVANQSLVFPNPVRRNNALTINVADMDLSGESYVEISGLNGQVVHRQPIVSKNGEVVVATRRLSSGQYIYTVVSNGVSLDTGKLIVK